MAYTIISYCCGTYPEIGGVARYDSQIKMIYPSRKFFLGTKDKNKMIKYLKTCKNPIIITDNHLACDIPNEYPIILVHHGCAKTHAEREPGWDEYWKKLCCDGQNKMLTYRKSLNTWIISSSQFCYDEFFKHYKENYLMFKNIKILHSSEFDETMYKTNFNINPIILGNWTSENKGLSIVKELSKNINYTFESLSITPKKNESIVEFNIRKQQIYINSDIFLQISLCEGNSYASLDALLCGLVVIASDVGLFYKDVPDDCFVKIPWEKNNDINFVLEKIEYGWKNKEKLSQNARKWYLENCNFLNWKYKMLSTIDELYVYNYKNNI